MSDPQPLPDKPVLNPRVQAGIAVLLLVMFAGVLFLPALIPTFKLDAAVEQVLLTLATVAVSFYLGSSSASASKDTALQAAASAAIPAPVVNVVAAPHMPVDAAPAKVEIVNAAEPVKVEVAKLAPHEDAGSHL